MPPKAAEKKIAVAVWEKTERVTLNQISVAEDSGWRDPADDHVELLDDTQPQIADMPFPSSMPQA